MFKYTDVMRLIINEQNGMTILNLRINQFGSNEMRKHKNSSFGNQSSFASSLIAVSGR